LLDAPAARPWLVRKEVKAGYAMGDHTWDHPNMNLLSAASQAREIDRARGSGSSFWVSRIIRFAVQEGRVLRHPVVLMHNQPAGNPATVSALPVIIRFFRAHGYRFVRV
jgi:peptidoglycan/xylan/chitin deacetylase (PgdA/CDA1 family)